MAESPRHKVVVAVLIERGVQVLAHRRPPGGWGAGMWEFPGGKLEHGEDVRDAAVRECREELGVLVSPGDIFDVQTFTYEDTGPVVLVFIRATLIEGDPASLEGGDVRWVAGHDMFELDWLAADWPIVHRLAMRSPG